MQDLEGILVLSLEQAVAAPLCTARLADAGARVIKVERDGGDFARHYDRVVLDQSAYFVWLNRGKESLVADIKNPDDQALLHAIAAKADVFIQNLAPGAAVRANLGSESLRASNPRLITVDISGYGDSSYEDMKAYDLLVQAESGVCELTGTSDGPARVGVPICDLGAGVNAHAAILQALFRRTRTGEGCSIRTSLFSGIADWMSVPYLSRRYGAVDLKRLGLTHPSIAPYGAFPARCGRFVLISIQNEREWRILCRDVLGDEATADDPRFVTVGDRFKNRRDLDEIICAAFGAHDRSALLERLREAGIACGALNDVADLAEHPALRLVRYETPGGSVETIAPPNDVDGMVPSYRAVPGLGQHSSSIRAEFSA